MEHGKRLTGSVPVLAGLVLLLAGYSPVLASVFAFPGSPGPEDWPLSTGMLEAMRKILREYGQFPWWNPFSSAGFPYFGNSINPGPVSIPGLLALVFSSLAALKIAVPLSAILGFAGMLRLSRRMTQDPWLQVAGAALFCCNGGIVMHLSAGHLFFDYFFYPWIIESLLVVRDESRGALTRKGMLWAAMGGGALGICCQTLIHYGFVYMLLSVAGILLASVARHGRSALRPLLVCYGILGLAFLGVGGTRLLTCLEVARDYPRVDRFELSPGVWLFLRTLIEPAQTLWTQSWTFLGWWEWGCYVGALSLALFVLAFFVRRTSYHWVFVIGALMFVYTDYPMPYYWLSHYVPLFKTMRVAARLRIWLIPWYAMGVLAGVDWLAGRDRLLARALAGAVVLDVCLTSFYAFEQAFWLAKPPAVSAPSEENSKPYPRLVRDTERGYSQYDAVTGGYTHIPGYEPAISEILWRMPSQMIQVRGFNETGYRGEFFTQSGPVEPAYWSPNRIEFKGIAGPLRINANPGSYWSVNGQEIFADLKVADIQHPFIVSPDAEGNVVLEVRPKGFARALWVSLLSLGLCLGIFFKFYPRAQARASA